MNEKHICRATFIGRMDTFDWEHFDLIFYADW